MKNYINHTLAFSCFLLLLLIALSMVPEGTSFGDFTLRKMDIFADVRAKGDLVEAWAPESDSLSLNEADSLFIEGMPQDSINTDSIVVGPFPPKDSSLYGLVIEDYSFDQSGLIKFFDAIDSIKHGRKVHIAWYGDSFVEGDILIGDLRDTLQTLWGGRGVGFVPITSEVAQFKRTLKHQFSNWNTFSVVKKSEIRPPLGINGYTYQPQAGASFKFEGANYFNNTKNWTEFKLFYTATTPILFEWNLQDKFVKTDMLNAKGKQLNTWEWDGNYPGANLLNVRFTQTEGLLCYGASLESGPGIYFDNFSIRGNSGGPLKLLKPEFIQQFDKIQQYDLVVLQVGLNAVTNGYDNIRWYQAELDRTFKHLRTCFPDKPILIISVGDRGGKSGTELATMLGVPAIAYMQRNLARQHGFLYYDLFHGMGGPGTMIRFAQQRPRLANTDYTHLTHDGGRFVGLIFANILQQEQIRWRLQKHMQ